MIICVMKLISELKNGARCNVLLRTFYYCSEHVKNKLFTYYCSNLYLCSLLAKYRKSFMQHFIVSYHNAFRILHNLPMRCSASFIFATAVIDNCNLTRIRKCIYSLMTRLSTSTNLIILRQVC